MVRVRARVATARAWLIEISRYGRGIRAHHARRLGLTNLRDRLRLRLRRARLARRWPRAPGGGARRHARASRMNARALIADDEAHLAEHLRARLAEAWPELEILPLAANGLEALRAINEEEPDVAFLDIRMPGLTGIELARRIDTQHARRVRDGVRPVRGRGLRSRGRGLHPEARHRRAPREVRSSACAARSRRPRNRPRWTTCSRSSRAPFPGGGAKLRWVRALKGERGAADRRGRRALLPGLRQVHVRDDARGRVADPHGARRARRAARRRGLLADPSRHRREHERGRLHAPRPGRTRLREAEGRQDGAAR